MHHGFRREHNTSRVAREHGAREHVDDLKVRRRHVEFGGVLLTVEEIKEKKEKEKKKKEEKRETVADIGTDTVCC